MPFVIVNGVRLFAELSGPGGAPVVLFSNSLGTSHAMWDALVPALRGRYRALRYDTRGHGQSQTLDRDTTIDDLASDMAGVMDHFGIEHAHIVGLSLGGMTGQAFAARWPERIESLTLMATAACMPPRLSWESRAAQVRAEGTVAIVEATMGRWFTQAFRDAEPDAVKGVRDGFIATDSVGYAVCCGVIAQMDLRPILNKVKAPTLVIAGGQDPATPVSSGQEICDHIGHAELVVLPRAAHLLAVQEPAATASHLLAFLDRHKPAKARGAVSFEDGLNNRRAVLGAEHVDRSLAKAGAFATPWQDHITRIAWGEMWGDPTLPWKSRSLITLAMMIALAREEEFKLHVRPALANGVTIDELQSLLLHCSIYAGVPASNGAFRWVREVLGDALD